MNATSFNIFKEQNLVLSLVFKYSIIIFILLIYN